MGMTFWMVMIIIDTIHDKPSITETYKNWNGGDPILIIKLIKIKYFTWNNILKVIIDLSLYLSSLQYACATFSHNKSLSLIHI